MGFADWWEEHQARKKVQDVGKRTRDRRKGTRSHAFLGTEYLPKEGRKDDSKVAKKEEGNIRRENEASNETTQISRHHPYPTNANFPFKAFINIHVPDTSNISTSNIALTSSKEHDSSKNNTKWNFDFRATDTMTFDPNEIISFET